MELVEEMLMEPRWDSTEFVLTKQEILSQIEQSKGNPNALAGEVFRKLIYRDNILASNSVGTIQSVQEISMDDLKDYYERNFTPNLANMHVVGSLGQNEIVAQLDGLQERWVPKDVDFPDVLNASQPASSKVYFYDVPGAKQSVLYFGYLAMPETDPDYYPATVMNYILGGGGFASRFTQELREGKGYTYGIGSGFEGDALPGPFRIFSGVRTNVTYESSALVKQILEDYPETFSEEDLENTKSYYLKSNARAFETAGAKLNMLQKLSEYGWDASYIKDREQAVKDISIEEIRELAKKYANPNNMYYVVVGDAATQMEKLKDLGFGEPVLIRDLESIPVGEMQ
jgi:zinc protease